VTAPASTSVSAGANSASFIVTGGSVNSSQTATVTAALNGSSKAASLTITAASPLPPSASGLVGYWTLDESSGSTAADSSGNSNAGTVAGTTSWTSGKFGGAFQFNGSTYIKVPNSASLSISGSQISFGAWYYHTASTDGYILGKTVSDYTYMLGVDKGAQQFAVYLKTGGTVRTLRWPGSVPNALSQYNNTWVHLFVTYDGATITAYVNGAKAATLAATGNINATSDAFAIGARGGDGSWTRFSGTIDDVRIYNRALAASEVQALYSGSGATAPPSIALFTASPASITAGASSTLSWNVSNATNLTIDQGVGSVTGSTSKSVSPSTTTTYTLTASNSGGSVQATATVTVTPSPTAGLSKLTCTASSVASGSSTQCTIALTTGAPAGGATVALSASGPLSVPSSVVISQGSQSASFTATAGSVNSNQTATISASWNSASASASLTVTATPAPPPGAAGLVGHWNFDDGSGSHAADASGNNNTGAFVGSPVWTSGIAAGALQFDGASYVSVPSSPSLSISGSQISFGAWYYHTTTTDGFLLGKMVSDYTFSLGVDRGAQQFVAYVKTGGQLSIVRLPASTPGGLTAYNNTWVHLFITYDGAAIRMYINGALAGSQSAAGNVTSNNDPFAIGARGGDGSWTRFNGRIDDVRVYNRALSAQEVSALYTTPGR
jgi:hypothetical protein